MADKKSKTPSNVTNPSLYSRVKSEAKRKFDVYPSAYANAWLVKTYKKRGGGYKGAKKAAEGGEMTKRKKSTIIKKPNQAQKDERAARKFRTTFGVDPRTVAKKSSKKVRKKVEGGEMSKLKPIPTDNKGLKKLPTKVRNKMGFMRNGGEVMMVQGRGCGAMMQNKRKKTKVPRS